MFTALGEFTSAYFSETEKWPDRTLLEIMTLEEKAQQLFSFARIVRLLHTLVGKCVAFLPDESFVWCV